MKAILRNILFILLLGFLVKCSEDEITSRNYPRLKTLPVSEITSEGARFNAEITFRGNFEVLNYGFVWRESENPTVENSERVIYSENIQANNFSAIIRTTLKDSISYFARAFIQTGEFTVYGENVQFTSLGGIAPELHSVNPKEAYRGDVVNIIGSGFSYQVNSIYFDGFLAEIISNSDSSLSVIIPEELTSVHPKIEIELLGRKAELVDALKLLGPTISSISRNQGIIGRDVLTLESSSITNSTTDYLVEINGVAFEIDVTELRVGSISFYLPPSSPIGNYPFTLIKESERFLNDFQLDLVSPWVQKSSLPGSVFGTYGSTFVINGKIYFANSTSTDDKDFWEYNPSTDSWEQKADIPGPPYSLRVAFAVNEIGYVGTGDCKAYYCATGFTGSSLFYSYSPDSDTWEQVSYIVGSPAFNGGLIGAIGFQDDNYGYMFAGLAPYDYYYNIPESNYWRYDPITDNWEIIGVFSEFNSYLLSPAGFQIDGLFYMGGGENNTAEKYNSNFWAFDPATNTWEDIAEFPGIPRRGAVGFSRDGFGYIGLGFNENYGNLKDFWKYDPSENQWRRVADLPASPREGAVSAEANGRVFVGLGTQENDLWEFQ
jgi:hypothetical protein